MSDWSYSDEELKNYFNDAGARGGKKGPHRWLLTFWNRKLGNERKAEAAALLSWVMAALVLVTLLLGLYFVSLIDELPPLTEIENPEFQLATIAYTADGTELARYARQNRSWVYYDDISPHVINALWATEDHRFYEHWGIDVFRTVASVGKTVLAKVGIPGFDVQGGSTISQQLARNLYNTRIGREQTIGRKMKETFADGIAHHAGGLGAKGGAFLRAESGQLLTAERGVDAAHGRDEIIDHPIGLRMADVESAQLAVRHDIQHGQFLSFEDS